MASVGSTLVDTVHFSGHPCILTTYLVLRLKSGFFLNFLQNCFGEMENFTGNLKHYILFPGGGGFPTVSNFVIQENIGTTQK